MDLRHLARNVLRALPCKFLSSACLEHSSEAALRADWSLVWARAAPPGTKRPVRRTPISMVRITVSFRGRDLQKLKTPANAWGSYPILTKVAPPKAAPAASRALEPRPLPTPARQKRPAISLTGMLRGAGGDSSATGGGKSCRQARGKTIRQEDRRSLQRESP